jgi:hypothetical protein
MVRARRLRKAIVILGATTAVLAVVGVIAMNAAMREPAMTSCPTLFLPTTKPPYATVTVETHYLPWKFTCVYHRGDHTVAKRPSPYSPPWPWK